MQSQATLATNPELVTGYQAEGSGYYANGGQLNSQFKRLSKHSSQI